MESLLVKEIQQHISEARKEFKEGKTKHFVDVSSMKRWMDEL